MYQVATRYAIPSLGIGVEGKIEELRSEIEGKDGKIEDAQNDIEELNEVTENKSGPTQ